MVAARKQINKQMIAQDVGKLIYNCLLNCSTPNKLEYIIKRGSPCTIDNTLKYNEISLSSQQVIFHI